MALKQMHINWNGIETKCILIEMPFKQIHINWNGVQKCILIEMEFKQMHINHIYVIE